MRRSPEGQSTVRRSRSAGNDSGRPVRQRWHYRPKLDWHTPVTMKVTLMPGATCRMRVDARGGTGYFDGGEILVDVLAAILNQQEPARLKG